MIGIYKITNPNNAVYIGQSVNIEWRFRKYKYLICKKQIKLYNSLNKYGIKNHKFEVIEECLESELNIKERYYQDLYNVLEKGLNCRLTKSDDKSGKLSSETKLKLSIAHKNKKLSKETKQKIANRIKGKKHSKESIIKMGTKIIDMDTNIIYDSVKEVSKKFNIKYTTLLSWLKGQNPNNSNFKYYVKN